MIFLMAHLHQPPSSLFPSAVHLQRPRKAAISRTPARPDSPGAERPLARAAAGCRAKARWRRYQRMFTRKAFTSRRSSQSLWPIGRSNYHGLLLFGLQPLCFSGSDLPCLKSCMVPGSPARPRGLPGGAEPARLRQHACGESRIAAHSRARLGFAGTFAILKTSWVEMAIYGWSRRRASCWAIL
jgi:hypothetical protein